MSARAKPAVRNKRMSERRSEWPIALRVDFSVIVPSVRSNHSCSSICFWAVTEMLVVTYTQSDAFKDKSCCSTSFFCDSGRSTKSSHGTDVQIPPVFYRTSSPPVPSGAAAQKECICITDQPTDRRTDSAAQRSARNWPRPPY